MAILDRTDRECCNCAMYQTTESPELPDISEAAADAQTFLEPVWQWIVTDVATIPVAVQLGILVAIVLVSVALGRRLSPQVVQLASKTDGRAWLSGRLSRLATLTAPLTANLLTWLATIAMRAAEQPAQLLSSATNLLLAWLLIRLITVMTRQTGLTQLIGAVIWFVAALAILGWLEPFIAALDAAAFNAGEMRFSLLTLINGVILVGALVWVAIFASSLLESQLQRVDGVTPAAGVLVGKVLRIGFLTVAVLVGLTSLGIDFTAVAVFSGAIGVGIGFGLQKVVSNLISGIILLLDRSIKPGDVIEIGEAYGWISKLGARYAAVVTRDGKEYLIPNEDLITQQVVNWSFSNRAVRIKIGVGVSYQSDVRRALELMMQSAEEHTRVLTSPPPATRLVGFGDNSVDLELRIWVDDPEAGVVNVSSDIRLHIWDLFHENDIEFPFPQRDLHITSADGLKEIMAEVMQNTRGAERQD